MNPKVIEPNSRFIDEQERGMRASERLARHISRDILGARSTAASEPIVLQNEASLAERYGVGRATVREALLLLESWGLLRIKLGRSGGAVTTDPETQNLGRQLGILLQFRGATLAELFDARRLLDGWMAGLAATYMSDEQLLRLGDAIRGIANSARDVDDFFKYNDTFYEVLAESSNNRALQILHQSIQSVTNEAVRGSNHTREWLETSANMRLRVFRAIASRDAVLAEKEMLAYRTEVNRYWMTRYPEVIAGIVDELSDEPYEEVWRAVATRTAAGEEHDGFPSG